MLSPSIEKFYEHLVSDNHSSFRDMVALRWNWFFHATSFEFLNEIKTSGLEPRDPGPCEVPGSLGNLKTKIVCLMPNVDPIDHWVGKIQAPFPRVLLAVSAENIPNKVLTDWSFPAGTNVLIEQYAENSEVDYIKLAECILLESRALACHEKIKPIDILICSVHADRCKPETWPRLLDIELSDVLLFHGDASLGEDDDSYGLDTL